MLLFCESYEKYGTITTGRNNMLNGVYADVIGNTYPKATNPRTGNNSLYCEGGAQTGWRRIFGAHKTVVGFGTAFYLPVLPSNDAVICIGFLADDSLNKCMALTISTTGQIIARTGPHTGTEIARSAPVIVANAWQHIEYKVGIDDSTGSVEVRVDGQTILNLSNVNTDGAGNGYCSQMWFGKDGGSGSGDWYADDSFAWDDTGSYNNDFIGDKKVYNLVPDGDTGVADWTPDTGGVGYSRINEIPPSDASYIKASAISDVSEFTMSDLPTGVSAIAGIQYYTRMLKTDAGDSNVQMSALSGSSNSDGTDRPITTAATYYTDVFEEDPDTTAAWTRTGINAMKIRATRTA